MLHVTAQEAHAADPGQEDLYAFPYHHLVDFDARSGAGFRTGRWYDGGLRYAAYMLHVQRAVGGEQFTSLVDVGCGDGWLASRLAASFPERAVVGVDVSPAALRLALSLPRPSNLGFVSCDIIQTVPPGAPFDCGTLVEVLEHIPLEEVSGFVAGLARLIRPSGRLFVTVPSVNLNRKRISRHHQHFTHDSLTATLSPYFDVETTSYINKKGRGDRLMRRMVSNTVFALTHEKALDFLFSWYMRHLFVADPQTGLRVFGVFRRKAT